MVQVTEKRGLEREKSEIDEWKEKIMKKDKQGLY